MAQSRLIEDKYLKSCGKTVSYLEDKSHKVGIYKWTNKINNKIYVGQSKGLRVRKLKFINFDLAIYAGNRINNARNKYNSSYYWNYEILDYCTKEELNNREIYYINYYKSNNKKFGYNLTNGGDSGHEWNIESREKVSKKLKGRKKSKETIEKIRKNNIGRHHTEEAKEKNRIAHIGKKISEETRVKMSKAQQKRAENISKHWKEYYKNHTHHQLGKPVSEKTKEKIRKANIGKTPWNKGYKMDEKSCKKMSEVKKGKTPWNKGKENIKSQIPIYQIDIESNEIIREWSCAYKVKEELGYDSSCITKVCKGKQKTAFGYVWKYK